MNLKDVAEKTDRVYSVIKMESYDDERREFEGIATTPATDRMGDIVEPMGAEFSLPIALLWQHDRYMPVGTITYAKQTKGGIKVKGSIPKIASPAGLSARLEEAWQSLKHGLVRGLSIGFSAKEYSFMDNGGIHFTKWEWHELSLVTIPANAEASITAIKTFDDQARAASGAQGKATAVPKPSGVTEKQHRTVSIIKPSEGKQMNIQEQIKGFESTRETKAARMTEILKASADAGTTLDAAQTEEYDTLKGEIDAIDSHIKRLKDAEGTLIKTAKPVQDVARSVERMTVHAVAKAPQASNGLALAQVAKFLGRAQGNRYEALQLAKAAAENSATGTDARTVNVLKAAVAAGVTSNAAWAGNLVGDETSVFADFIEYLRPRTILGQFGAGNVPSLRSVPFRTALVGQSTGGAASWVGEAKPKRLTKFDFTRTTLDPLKIATIAVVSEEVLRDSSPSADMLIRDSLAAAVIERSDIDFIDPAKAAVSGVSPASITNAATPIVSSGNDAADVRADVRALFNAFIAANNAPTNGVFIMAATTALALSLMQNPLGQAEFPGIGMNGGMLFGMPVIVSEYVPSDSNGSYVMLVNASDIYYADMGGVAIDISREASLQMDDTPTDPVTASTVLVSLWQHNLVGFRAERTLNWALRRTSAVSVLSGVNWGA